MIRRGQGRFYILYYIYINILLLYIYVYTYLKNMEKGKKEAGRGGGCLYVKRFCRQRYVVSLSGGWHKHVNPDLNLVLCVTLTYHYFTKLVHDTTHSSYPTTNLPSYFISRLSLFYMESRVGSWLEKVTVKHLHFVKWMPLALWRRRRRK